MMDKITPYSSSYLFGKASKVVPGEYHLVITAPFFSNQKPLFKDHVPFCGYKVLKLESVHYHGPYSYSVLGTRCEKGRYHRVGHYYWFCQPKWQSLVDVFPLGTDNQEDAEKNAEFLLEAVKDCRDRGLYAPLKGYEL